MTTASTEQLGFDALLNDAESDNRSRKFERETAHLPATFGAAIPFYRQLIEQNHTAMLAADVDEVTHLHDEAYKLALRLNNGEPGILANNDAPGCALERETKAAPGVTPLWGQSGEFIITVGAMRVRIEMDGIFGIGGRSSFWSGFSTHAIDYDRPFLSETGYRSFLGIFAAPQSGFTPNSFTHKVISTYVEGELKGKLMPIAGLYKNGQQEWQRQS